MTRVACCLAIYVLLEITAVAVHYWLARDFKNELDFDRHAEGQAGDAEDDAAREHPGAEDLDEELGRSIGDFRMVPEVAFRRDIDSELRYAGYLVERAEIRLGRG